MFIGFNVTFLIQHSAGPERHAAPRLRVPERRPPGALQPDLDDRLVHPGARHPADDHQRRPLPQVAARSPARTRGRRTRSSGSPPRRRRVNNFDVIPRVRSVEPMKDIRRQVERQSSQTAAAAGASTERLSRPWTPRAPPPSPRRSHASGAPASLSDYVALTKPKVQSLLLLTTVCAMYVAGVAVGRPGARDGDRRLPVRRRRRARSTTGTTATSTSRWRAPPTGRSRRGRVSPRAALTFGLDARRPVRRLARRAGQPAGRGPVRSPGFVGYAVVYTHAGSSAARRRTSSSAAPPAPSRRSSAGPRSTGGSPASRSTCSRSSSSGPRPTSGRWRC